MNIEDPTFVPFLLRAKKNTYAAGDGGRIHSSRPASHDLAYREDDWYYQDTYLGGFAFSGEEAVWFEGKPLWGMNYYGTLTIDSIPEGFGDFLKLALRDVPQQAPYRGPAAYSAGAFAYTCHWSGVLANFQGDETISWNGRMIYKLSFHGGKIIE